ncbi:MAG TPA: NAD(P)H-hydrate dehydratase [Luteimonas sp.]|nr:NAD(P)H-hydrate dehydratase [Luteimonas sp.]
MSPTAALYDPDALRLLEARATEACGGYAFTLMQRAGQAAWRYLLDYWPQAQRIVVACGPGNNGGDGYVLATHAQRSGRDVRVLRLDQHAPRSELARRACREYLESGGRIENFDEAMPAADLFVDALFGIGLSSAPDAATTAMIDATNVQPAPVFALDVPSGVDAGCGHVPGTAIVATRTLQFIAAHCGLATGKALDHTGACDFASLDVPSSAFDGIPVAATALGPDALSGWLQPRPRDSHKGSNGHVLCIGGDHGSGGAVMLCAQAALRCGAGLVSVATRGEHVSALLAHCPEVMVHSVESADALAALLLRATVIAIGPGLGQASWGRTLLDSATTAGKPALLDADALNLLAATPRPVPSDTILTPHPREAARLLGTTASNVQADRYAAARELATRFDCVVVLKGAGTIVAAPGEIPRVIAAGNPGMAVGGMGDVLSGVIAALRAQGLSAFDAASCGALLHAAAGDAAAGDGGERGLLPSDLLPHLRRLANPQVRPQVRR